MIDHALAFYLVLVLPAMRLWRSLRPADGPRPARAQSYANGIREILLLLVALLLVSWWSGHGASDLGVDMPEGGAGLWCLLVPLILVPTLHYAGKLRERTMPPEQLAADIERLRKDDSLPGTARELSLFLLLALCMGTGWELLYRGYLQLVLAPALGVWGAALVAGVAYGVAHGYTNTRQITTSTITSLLFSSAYALTHNLWWLILLHVSLPALGAIGYYKLIQQHPGATQPV